jgi:predicted protein tyrosine phosphatase
MEKVLFVCACNLNRSPTFAEYFDRHHSGVFVKSAGIYEGYPYQVNEETLTWADKVFVMDISQEMFIQKHYPDFIHKVKIIGVSDQYDRGSPELLDIIKYWVGRQEWLKSQ